MFFSRFKYSYFFLGLFLTLCLFGCKTKKAPIVILRERTFVIQVCDKFQMSYDGLPCSVYFSDGTNALHTTATDGKIIVKLSNPLIKIEKVVYNFTSYRQRAGTLLAKEDFKLAVRIPSSLASKEVTVANPFSDKVKNLFVLVR